MGVGQLASFVLIFLGKPSNVRQNAVFGWNTEGWGQIISFCILSYQWIQWGEINQHHNDIEIKNYKMKDFSVEFFQKHDLFYNFLQINLSLAHKCSMKTGVSLWYQNNHIRVVFWPFTFHKWPLFIAFKHFQRSWKFQGVVCWVLL